MRVITPKIFSYYMFFGCLCSLAYSAISYLYFDPPAEEFWARWPFVFTAIVLMAIIHWKKLNAKQAEFLFYISISILTANYLFLLKQTDQQPYYFQGLILITLGSSLMIFNKSDLFKDQPASPVRSSLGIRRTE